MRQGAMWGRGWGWGGVEAGEAGGGRGCVQRGGGGRELCGGGGVCGGQVIGRSNEACLCVYWFRCLGFLRGSCAGGVACTRSGVQPVKALWQSRSPRHIPVPARPSCFRLIKPAL